LTRPQSHYLPVVEDKELRCEKCGYNLTGLIEPRCPECGQYGRYEKVLSGVDVYERRKALATVLLLGVITAVSTIATWFMPSRNQGSMYVYGGLITIPIIIFCICVNGLGLILGLAAIFSRPYRWVTLIFLLILGVDCLIFVRKIM